MNIEEGFFDLKQDIQVDEQKQPTRRLIINKISMENFKSYYGTLEIGPFHRRFTSIVGPNGSGKSNLIESLLFVFGKRANWMRLKSLHQLIHNSSKHSDIKKASVQVEFMEVEDRNDETIDIPNTKFTVKRTVHHTGQSNYHINDQHATLEEVTKLLMGKGIDLNNNRFLILQGEVEQISLMKPKSNDPERPGLLEYLEDIIGSAVYQQEIDDLSQDHERLDAMRRERGEIMRIVEQDLQRLEPAKNKAVEFVKKEKQGMQLQNIQIQVAQYKSQQLIKKTEDNIKQLEQQNKGLINEIDDKIKEHKESLKIFQEKKNKQQQVTQEKKNLEQQMLTSNLKDKDLRAELKQVSAQIHRQQTRLKEIKDDRTKISDEQAENEKMLPDEEKKLQELQQKKDLLEKNYNELQKVHKEATQDLINQKKKIEKKISPQVQEQEKLQREVEVLQSRFNQLKQQSGDGVQNLDKLQKEKLKFQDDRQEQQKAVSKLEEVLKQIDLLRQEDQQKQQELHKNIQQLDQEIRQIKLQIDSINHSHNQTQEHNITVKAIMTASAKGQLKGVIGRVGDLGWIPKEYDIAVTTSGNGLGQILVENDEYAKQCIEFLKINKIGRQTFLSLSRLKQTIDINKMNNFQAPNNSRRLYDLVHPKKEEYKLAFYFILKNTLVCENIDIAKNIEQNQRHKIVTLDGKVIDSNRIMSGGGPIRRGGMNVNGQHSQQYGERNNVQELKQKYESLQEQRFKLEKEIEFIQNESLTRDKEYQHIKTQHIFNYRQLQESDDRIDEMGKRLEQLQQLEKKFVQTFEERKQIEKDIDQKQKQMKKIQESFQVEGQQIQEISSKIQSLESNELKVQKEKYDHINKEYETTELLVNKLHHKLQTFSKKYQKLNYEESEVQKSLKELIQQKEQIQNQISELEDVAQQTLGKIKFSTEIEKQLSDEINKYKESNIIVSNTLEEIKSKLTESKNLIDENNKAVHKLNEEIKLLKRRLDEVRQNYKETIKEYDFINELDEIANYKLQQDDKVQVQDDYTLLNISFVDDNFSMTMDDGDNRPKKRSNVIQELQHLLEFDVTQDLDTEQLERCCPIEKEIARVITHIQAKTGEAARDTNIQDISTFKNKYLDFKDKKFHLDKVREDIAQNKLKSDKLKKERYDKFMSGFNVISQRLRETYQTLTNGGDAELELVDTMDPFAEGVNFSVRPKNKSWKQMSKLSGGEKTLSSLSLIFALHYFRPTPLYFFDEVDAALDYRNVSIVGNYVKERTKNAQFIVISLRNNMFELAHKLVGIYKTMDMTKTISIQPELVLMKVTGNDENSRHLANH